MKKRILSAALAVCMVLTLLATTVFAGKIQRTVRTTTLDLTDISDAKLYGSTKSGNVYTNTDEGWAWYAANTMVGSDTYAANTLVLSGLTVNTTDANAIKIPDGTTLVLAADTTSTLKSGDVSSDAADIYANCVNGMGALTIRGSGTLNVTSGNAAFTGDYSEQSGQSVGIYSEGALTIGGTAIITSTSGTADTRGNESTSAGVFSAGNLTISGGSVTGVGAAAVDSFGIGSAGAFTITGGIVTAKNDTAFICCPAQKDTALTGKGVGVEVIAHGNGLVFHSAYAVTGFKGDRVGKADDHGVAAGHDEPLARNCAATGFNHICAIGGICNRGRFCAAAYGEGATGHDCALW